MACRGAVVATRRATRVSFSPTTAPAAPSFTFERRRSASAADHHASPTGSRPATYRRSPPRFQPRRAFDLLRTGATTLPASPAGRRFRRADLAVKGGAGPGTAAFHASGAKPWSRRPTSTRRGARAVELMPTGELLSRQALRRAACRRWLTWMTSSCRGGRPRGRSCARSATGASCSRTRRPAAHHQLANSRRRSRPRAEMPDARSAASDLAPVLAEMQGLAAALAKIQLP